jgi:hypothetical protein
VDLDQRPLVDSRDTKPVRHRVTPCYHGCYQ